MSKTQVASTKPRPRSLWIRRLLSSFITTSPHVSIYHVISWRLRVRALTRQCVHVTVASRGTQQDLQWGCHRETLCVSHSEAAASPRGAAPSALGAPGSQAGAWLSESPRVPHTRDISQGARWQVCG